MSAKEVNPRCYIDFKQGDEPLGRIIIEIFADVVPKTAANFIALCNGKHRNDRGVRLYYKNSIVHRVIQSFMIQMGDFTKGNGTGGCSVYGEHFDDENFTIKHDKYYLSMANAGANTNGSQFFICTDECSHLNGKHVVYGRVIDGKEVIDKIEAVETDSRDKPLETIKVSKCGQLVQIKQSALQQNEEEEQEEKDEKEDNDRESDSESESVSSDETDEYENERKRKKKKREFHLNSVNYVDETGRVRKGKGKFRYMPERNDRNRGYERERNRINPRKYRRDPNEYENKEDQENEIVFSQYMEFGTIDNDQNTVSSTISIFSVDELQRQDRIEHRVLDSQTESRSRSRSRSRHRHK